MANKKRLIDAYKLEDLLRSNSARYHHKDDVIAAIAGQPTVDAVEVVRCAYCDPGSRDYNPCWLCKKGGTAHDVEHCHVTNYGDYEPMQPHCHLCGRKL